MPEEVNNPGLHGLLMRLLDSEGYLYFTRTVDEDGETHFHAHHCLDSRAQLRGKLEHVTVSRRTLIETIHALGVGGDPEKEPKRTCLRCLQDRSLGMFSRDANGPGGQNRYCRICEGKRVKKYDDGKKGGSVAPPPPVS